MAYIKSEPFIAQFTDPASGLLMSNGTIEFYLFGISTPTPYYTDSAGTAGGTSLTLDTGGKPPNDIFFDDGIVYKIVVKDSSGTTLETMGPFSAYGTESFPLKRQYISDLTSETATIGQFFIVEDYASGNNSGVMHFRAVAAATGIDDGGSYVDHDSLAIQFEQIFGSTVSIKQFGAAGGNASVDSTACQEAMNYKNRIFIPTPSSPYIFANLVPNRGQVITGDQMYDGGG